MLVAHEILIVAVTGLILGSFASALAWRVPRGLGWVKTRSACPHCNKILTANELVPLLSWLLQRGKCRQCSAKIGVRYPLIELGTMICCLAVYATWGFTVPAFLIIAAVPFLVALFVIDLEHMILPNTLVLAVAVIGAVFIFYAGYKTDMYGQIVHGVAAAAVFAGISWITGFLMGKILKKEALGLGDVKFFAASGLWLGLFYMPYFLIFSGFSGVCIGVGYRIFSKKAVFPFGPALILALYTGLLLQGVEIIPFIGVK